MIYQILQLIFFIILGVILNAFLIYPLIMNIIALCKKRSAKAAPQNQLPNITILFAAYNEEKVIEERIENIASLNYDFDKIQVIAGSDLSNDDTNKILERLENKYTWLQLFISSKRMGKAGILNSIVPKSKGEIIVFSDANTIFHKDAIKNLVAEFSSPQIGAVSGKLVLLDNKVDISEGVEETKYWAFETSIKIGEGRLGILMGANGALFAIRKDLFDNIPTDKAVTDDLFVSLNVLAKGYKVKYCSNALAFESVGVTIGEEFKRKARYSATNFQTLLFFGKKLLLKTPLITYAFFSHRISRWILPLLLILLFVNTLLLSFFNSGYLVFLYFQCIFYLFAVLGLVLNKFKLRVIVFSLPYFFIVTNAAILTGLIRFIMGKHTVIWDPTERAQ